MPTRRRTAAIAIITTTPRADVVARRFARDIEHFGYRF
jgi:hypothetical protein